MSGDILRNTLRALQRRLWLERLLFRLRDAIWIGSLLLLAIAAVSLLWFPVAPLHAAFAALVAVFIVTLSAILLRPSLRECALKADRQFGSDLLLTTALEMRAIPVSDMPAAAHVVLQQAADAAPRWRQQLNTVCHAPPLPGFALATIPVFAAALLLSLSTYRDVGASVSGAAVESAATGSANAPLLEDASDLLVLRESIVRDSSRRRDVPIDEEPGANSIRITSQDAASRRDDQAPGMAESKSASTDYESDGSAGGRDPGDARPTRDAGEAAPGGASEPFAKRSVEIARLGAPTAVAAKSDGEFTKQASAPSANRARKPAAAAPPALSAWTTLTPAEVAYARRYLERTETQRD